MYVFLHFYKRTYNVHSYTKDVIKYLFSALSKVSYLQGICKLQFKHIGLKIVIVSFCSTINHCLPL
jgi:hypothetical protein